MAEKGLLASVHYTGTLEDGSVFDSSEGREPIEFIAGAGQVIPGFDDAVLEMSVGDKKSIRIPCAEAYGEYREELIEAVPMNQIPNSEQLPVGQTIFLTGPGGQPMSAKVLKIEDGNAYFDLNHELAGKDLNFDLELVDLKEAPSNGVPTGGCNCEVDNCNPNTCGCG